MSDGSEWSEVVINHIAENKYLCRGILGAEVMTTGSGPYDEHQFDQALVLCGIGVCDMSAEGIDVLIVGREGWEADDLDQLISEREGGELRVYSHEMVLGSLAIGRDVFEVCTVEELASFAPGHPALTYLMHDRGFDWPTTEVTLSSGGLVVDFSEGMWPETGVLGQLGYKVGRSGLGEVERRAILDESFRVVLRPGSDGAAAYIAEWGEPRSPRRLEKIAHCLSSFAQAKKRDMHRDYSAAIADWEDDLEYLREMYFVPLMGFSWPNTRVPGR